MRELLSIPGLFAIVFIFLIVLGIINIINKRIFYNKRFGLSFILFGFSGLILIISFIFIIYSFDDNNTEVIHIEIEDNIIDLDFMDFYELLKEQTKIESELKMKKNISSDLTIDQEGNIIKFSLRFYGYKHGVSYLYTGSIHDGSLELFGRPYSMKEDDLYDFKEHLNYLNYIDFNYLMEDLKPIYDTAYMDLLEKGEIDKNDLVGYRFYFQHQDGFDWEQRVNNIHLIYKDGHIGPWDNDVNGMDISFGIRYCYIIWGDMDGRSIRYLNQSYYIIDEYH